MIGPEHYRESELLLDLERATSDPRERTLLLRRAQAEATLALAAATALGQCATNGTGEASMPLADFGAWDNVAGVKA